MGNKIPQIIKIFYKHFYISPNTNNDSELNKFIEDNICVDVSSQIFEDKVIVYTVKYLNVENVKLKDYDHRDKPKLYYDESTDYLSLLNPIQGACYRYAKDIRNLIAKIIKAQSANIMTNYMIYKVCKECNDVSINSLKTNKTIPTIFFEKLSNMYTTIYNNHYNDSFEYYKNNLRGSSLLSRDISMINKYSNMFSNLIGCYHYFSMPEDLKQMTLYNEANK